MSLLKGISKVFRNFKMQKSEQGELYEFCPRCDANLTLQKGYRNDVPYWICKGCGEMLINPAVVSEDNVVWICDRCGAILNLQDGFVDHGEEWGCTECGFVNRIDESQIYASEDEFQAEKRSPYKGLPNEAALALSVYQELEYIDDRPDIILVRHRENGRRYVKKLLATYNRSVYDFLKDHPVAHMPIILEIYESDNCLIVIEEHLEGKTVADLLEDGSFSTERAVLIGIDLCGILNDLHSLPTPIVHRDIKPSNIVITPENDVYLLDMNVAKWFDPDKTDDTRHLGTRYYAAPEQVGYGLSASSPKSDVYAMGVLLNVMTTRRLPKEERAGGGLWPIIERCISLDANDRYTATELKTALEELRGKIHAEETDR